MEECSNRKQYRFWGDLCKSGGRGIKLPITFMSLNSMRLVDKEEFLEDNNLLVTFTSTTSLSLVEPHPGFHKAKGRNIMKPILLISR